MEFRIDTRGAGKTEMLIDWLLAGEDEDRVVVTHSEHDAMRLHKDPRVAALRDRRGRRIVFGWREVNDRHVLRGRRCIVGIDNADLILSQLVDAPIDYVTATETRFDHTPHDRHSLRAVPS